LNTRNLKLLGIYYAVNKVLENNLAAPLGKALNPTLNMDGDDNSLIAEKTHPFLKRGISSEKLRAVIQKVFATIDNGNISPNQYLGQEFTVEETIDQFEKHDSFIHLYDNFINNVLETKAEAKNKIIEHITIDSIKLNLNSAEALQLKSLFNGEVRRAPLTLDTDELRAIIDSLYEVTCDHIGPMNTDKFLSAAVKNSQKIVPTFDSSTFL